MSNTIKVVQTVDQRDVVKAMQEQARLLDRVTSKLDQMGKRGASAGEESAKGMGKSKDQLTGMKIAASAASAAYQGLQQLLKMVTQQYEDLLAAQGRAAGTQRTVATAQRAAAFNFGVDNLPKMNAAVQSIGDETGANAVALYDALSVAASSRGNRSIDDAIEAVRQAARIEPNNEQAIQTGANAILTQQQATGGTAEEIAGFQMRFKASSKIASNDAFAKNVVPALANMVRLGATENESAALLTYLGHQMGDTEGAMTGTAGIQLLKQLKQINPDASATETLQQIQQSPELQRRLLGSFSGNVDPALQKDILAGKVKATAPELTGEAKAFAGYVSLLRGEGLPELQQYGQAIGEHQGSGKYFNEQLAAVDAMQQQQVLREQNKLRNLTERAQLDNPLANVAEVDAAFNEQMKQAGYGGATQWWHVNSAQDEQSPWYLTLSDEANQAAVFEDTDQQMRVRARMLRVAAKREESLGETTDANNLTTLAKAIEDAADRLQKQLEENSRKTAENTEATRDGNRKPDSSGRDPSGQQQRGS